MQTQIMINVILSILLLGSVQNLKKNNWTLFQLNPDRSVQNTNQDDLIIHFREDKSDEVTDIFPLASFNSGKILFLKNEKEDLDKIVPGDYVYFYEINTVIEAGWFHNVEIPFTETVLESLEIGEDSEIYTEPLKLVKWDLSFDPLNLYLAYLSNNEVIKTYKKNKNQELCLTFPETPTLDSIINNQPDEYLALKKSFFTDIVNFEAKKLFQGQISDEQLTPIFSSLIDEISAIEWNKGLQNNLETDDFQKMFNELMNKHNRNLVFEVMNNMRMNSVSRESWNVSNVTERNKFLRLVIMEMMSFEYAKFGRQNMNFQNEKLAVSICNKINAQLLEISGNNPQVKKSGIFLKGRLLRFAHPKGMQFYYWLTRNSAQIDEFLAQYLEISEQLFKVSSFVSTDGKLFDGDLFKKIIRYFEPYIFNNSQLEKRNILIFKNSKNNEKFLI